MSSIQLEQRIQIIDFLKANIENLISVTLFGSATKNRLTSNSDIDLAFLSYDKVDSEKLHLLQNKLSELLKHEVDLIPMRETDSILNYQIFKNGLILFISDSIPDIREYHAFKVLKLAEYNDVQLMRRPQEEYILKHRVV